MFGAPQPRFRIYTRTSTYIRLFFEFLTGAFRAGNAIDDVEKDIASLAGAKHALFTPTCRTGIYLTLSHLIKPGQKVLLSPLTIVDVINMVLCAGGVPVFVDVEKNTCNIDADKIEKLIDKDTGAVFITHLHGLACDVKKIRSICDKHNVPLVEDAAQAFSTKVDGKWMGTYGRAGVFSFGMYKNVNAFYGGMILTDDTGLYEKCKEKLASHGYMPYTQYMSKSVFGFATDLSTSPLPFSLFTYWLFRYGYLNNVSALNDLVTVDLHPKRQDRLPPFYLCRMNPGQARLIYKQLAQVEENNQRRIKTAQLYDDGLSSLPKVIRPPLRTDGSHIYTYYPIRVPDRRDLMHYAMEKRRDFVLSHYHNTAGLDVFKEFYRDCPNAAATANELIYLPTYPRYRESQVKRNIEVIQSYFKERA